MSISNFKFRLNGFMLSSETASNYSHMRFKEGALHCYFSFSKNDLISYENDPRQFYLIPRVSVVGTVCQV